MWSMDADDTHALILTSGRSLCVCDSAAVFGC